MLLPVFNSRISKGNLSLVKFLMEEVEKFSYVMTCLRFSRYLLDHRKLVHVTP